MNQIKSFKDLGVGLPKALHFVGEHIKIKNLLDKEIRIDNYDIKKSNFEGDRLDMQIFYREENHVTWTSSKYLLETIKLIPKDKLPFTTTIVKRDDHYQFT